MALSAASSPAFVSLYNTRTGTWHSFDAAHAAAILALQADWFERLGVAAEWAIQPPSSVPAVLVLPPDVTCTTTILPSAPPESSAADAAESTPSRRRSRPARREGTT